jgi:hypothetical protein
MARGADRGDLSPGAGRDRHLAAKGSSKTMRYYKFSAADRRLVMAETELPEPGPGQVRVSGRVTHLGVPDHKTACEGTSRRRPTLRGRVHEAQWSTACAGILDTIL